MFFFTGPVLLILSLIFNWILGNFLEMMTAGLFAVFWLSFGVLELPSWGLIASYSPTGDVAEGAASVEFNACIGLFGIAWGIILLTFFFFSLRRTVVSASIFGFASVGVFVLDAS
jgi:succinate-acetate transporter protein